MNLGAPTLGTFNLTNALHDGIILGESNGISKFSIQCTSATAITILGTKKMTLTKSGGGTVDLVSETINVAENGIFNWSKDSGIKSVTIGIPSGATAKLTVL